VSTAALVPETWKLSGDDARKALVGTGRRRLLTDAFMRLRWADGFSHARSLAFLVSLTAVQGLITLVGLTTAFGNSETGEVLVRSIKHAAPGPVGDLVTTAANQARSGVAHHHLGLVLGLVGGLVSATTAMGQLERGLNRIYGVEKDRDAVHKYGLAFVLAVTAGALLTLASALLAFGRTIGGSVHSPLLSRCWDVASWPIGLALFTAGLGLLFRWCPRRRQPGWSWLAFGAAVSTGLWAVITLALGAFFRNSDSFGKTYGPLAGTVALMLWALLTSMATYYGAAVAAQLEAVRAHAAEPQDDEKVESSEPDAAPVRAGASS
jgi:YihY family inner membrane protein